VLLGGTSGCGKSTLASLLASRLGITTVLSTDFVRHMLRKIIGRDKEPLLWASTYNAGACLEHPASISAEEQVLRGYHGQSSLLVENLSYLIGSYVARNESLIIEGVHLSVEIIVELMKRHPRCVPMIICINNEGKHKERFAVRAKYMTLDGRHNRYIKFFRNIRVIQNSLLKTAQQQLIPQIDNTNVDRSVTAVHDILVKSMRMLYKGRLLYDADRGQATELWQIYSQRIKQTWSSKSMLGIIRSKCVKGEVFRRYFEGRNDSSPPAMLPPPKDDPAAEDAFADFDSPIVERATPGLQEQDDRSEADERGGGGRLDNQRDGTEGRGPATSISGSVGLTTMKQGSDKGADSDSSSSGSHHSELSAAYPDEEDDGTLSLINVPGSNVGEIDALSLPDEVDEDEGGPSHTPPPLDPTQTKAAQRD